MQAVFDGDRVVIARGGNGFVGEQSDKLVSANVVKARLARQWLIEPAYPLFGDYRAGTLTVRGQFALNRFNFG